MAILSDYTAGTVSSSGTTITGTGTGWKAAEFQEGDIFIAAGYWALVASVDSNTQLTLVDWAGPVLSGSAYHLRYMSDGSRASAQARQLIDMLGGSGTLEALAGLTGTPDTLPFFTGPGTAGTTSLTPFARTFLGRADAAAARTGLGASTTGSSLFTATNAAAARSSLELSQGLQTPSSYPDGLLTTVDQHLPFGQYAVNVNTVGIPIPVAGGLFVKERWSTQSHQTYFTIATPIRVFERLWFAGPPSSATPWREVFSGTDAADMRSQIGANNASNLNAGTLPDARLSAAVYRRSNILGPVSQSGGVPTGAIAERGSNANGQYVRWADGTQECFTSTQVFLDSNAFQAPTMPAAFAENSYPRVAISPEIAPLVGTNANWRKGLERLVAYSTAAGALYLLVDGSFPTSGIVYGYHVGRWF